MRVSIPQDDFPFYISSGPVYQKGDTLIIAGTYNDAGRGSVLCSKEVVLSLWFKEPTEKTILTQSEQP